ncbi:uncharacterized protein BO96DRAFT_80855 [Aspergillus niger CBS 101883]|uniref:uncharacterized protein n=1 Tax=Aspergillus lacticoffeatus (strain CBS 101883) TaxID=1450533 RepID=UPI000D7F7F55|nr:uncharacterized protein BO96DRAFT_80855 [Aspergillus niger CBS 101883]PYH54824.1 hypothetical protein BO96DRAFT_80855 [Aspergillus niger CBS 101883]
MFLSSDLGSNDASPQQPLVLVESEFMGRVSQQPVMSDPLRRAPAAPSRLNCSREGA